MYSFCYAGAPVKIALLCLLQECKCSEFYTAIEPRLEEASVKYITEHEGFAANCLNRWVFETFFYEYLQENGPFEENELIHKNTPLSHS